MYASSSMYIVPIPRPLRLQRVALRSVWDGFRTHRWAARRARRSPETSRASCRVAPVADHRYPMPITIKDKDTSVTVPAPVPVDQSTHSTQNQRKSSHPSMPALSGFRLRLTRLTTPPRGWPTAVSHEWGIDPSLPRRVYAVKPQRYTFRRSRVQPRWPIYQRKEKPARP